MRPDTGDILGWFVVATPGPFDMLIYRRNAKWIKRHWE